MFVQIVKPTHGAGVVVGSQFEQVPPIESKSLFGASSDIVITFAQYSCVEGGDSSDNSFLTLIILLVCGL